MKIEEISSLKESGKYACNVCGKEYTKNGISTHFWLKHGSGSDHLEFLMSQCKELQELNRGKPSWNSGLTAETDPRVAKTRNSLLKRIEEGEFYQGRIGVPLKKTTREKISEARSKFLNERGNGGFRNVKWYRAVDSFGNECSLRGTWEKDVADWLNLQGVQWTRKHYLKYFDGSIIRTYSPDFWIPADNLIIEVKGYFSDKDKNKMKLVQEQNPEILIRFFMKNDIEQLQNMAYNHHTKGL